LFPNQLYARIAVMLMPASKRPVVITTEHSTYNNRRKYSLLKILDKWMYKGYDKIVCISKQTERNLREWLDQINLGNRIVTICNGVNLSKFIPINSEEERSKNVVMVARLEHPKDPLTVVRAISKCPSDVNLYFVGSGYMDSSVKELSKELNIEDRVHLLGNRKDVPEILHNSGIGVLSTEWEGFGLVLVEYMATGLPILMSEVDGIQDVVGDRDSLFVNGDDDELAGKITRLIEDKDFYTAKSRFFKDRSSEFSIERMNKTYIDLYRNLLS
ncbi:MAG: glycosyltransferase family 4 protein, partial [Muribaculaceae bacterium]|nr:glycosyltransferase family 4 protein [Muribaculaceae bacterium]